MHLKAVPLGGSFLLILLGPLALATAQLAAPASADVPALYTLEQFGPTQSVQQAQQTFETACAQIIAAGGGVLFIPREAAADWRPQNTSQEQWRRPAPPAPASEGWGPGPGVTVVDYRDGTVKIFVPQGTGMEFNRVLKLPEGQGLPHWGYHPLLRMENSIVRGSTSYREYLSEPVAAGKDRRFYVPTIRGLFPGMFLNAGDWGKVQRLYVKSLGYDHERQAWYFVADTDADVPDNRLVHNKNHTNILRMDTYSHNENQTFDLMVWRHNYSQGDNYLIDAQFNYMGDVHSTNGDENGVLYAGFVVSETDIFRGVVESRNAQLNELKYRDPVNAHTIGSGRPIINLNPEKWINAGHAFVIFQGQGGGTTSMGWSNGIRSTDPSWTAAVIGRYFALDEPDEYVPGGDKVRRWYLITSFREEEGVKMIGVQRHWWGAKNNKSLGRLYNPANYTYSEQQPKLLRYIIAPGANAYDVAEAVESHVVNVNGSERILKVVPSSFTGSDADFGPGDPIEQAIGPDPFRPIPWRSWLFEKIPGAFPSPIFDVANRSEVQSYSVMTVMGGSGSADEDQQKSYDHRVPWHYLFRFNTATQVGISFAADVADSAIVFEQPHVASGRAQELRWNGKVRRTLGVNDEGLWRITGDAPLALDQQGLSAVAGLSGSQTAARNLRGLKVAVVQDARSIRIAFPLAEADAEYAVIVEPSWLTRRAVEDQTAEGFTVTFDQPAPAEAVVDWLIVR